MISSHVVELLRFAVRDLSHRIDLHCIRLALLTASGIHRYANGDPAEVAGQALRVFKIDFAELGYGNVERVLQQVARTLIVSGTTQQEETQAFAVAFDQRRLCLTVAGADTLHDRRCDPRFLLQRWILLVQWYYEGTWHPRSRLA